MLQRFLGPQSRRIAFVGSQETCAVCRCSCGRKFRQNGLSIPERRFYEPKKLAKSPYAQQVEAMKLREQKQKLKEQESTRHHGILLKMKQSGSIKGDVDNMIEFLNSFAILSQTKRGRGGVAVDEKAFNELISEFGIDRNDAHTCALMLLYDRDPDRRLLGKRLMYSLAHWGDIAAILHIMQQVLVEAKTRPKVLNTSELAGVRKRLSLMAETVAVDGGDDHAFIVIVLEGKVAYALGDVNRAIALWTSAIDAAVALSEKDRLTGQVLRFEDNAFTVAMLTPWVDLTNAYLQRDNLDKARWAIEIGCQQDDPSSHYYAAILEQKTDQHDQLWATSTWLFHMTKAAGAGHVKATHALGHFYGGSGWKYIEDEPPDHLKPTPFDSYPPDLDSTRKVTPFWDRFTGAVGLGPPPERDALSSLFLSATQPSTPYDRFRMAMQWLEVGIGMMYAPSYLRAAQLLLNETLWPQAQAPKEALELKHSRYTYASRADYEAGIPIDRPSEEIENEEETIPNPGYDPERAKDLIRDVLYAKQAVAWSQKAMKNIAKARSRGVNMSDFDLDRAFAERNLSNELAPDVRKWFRFPETREMYMNDTTGTLYDDFLKTDLDVQARQICDEQEWDIYDEDGGLMYRYVRSVLRLDS